MLSCGVYVKDGILVILRGPLSTAATELAGREGVLLEDWRELVFCNADDP